MFRRAFTAAASKSRFAFGGFKTGAVGGAAGIGLMAATAVAVSKPESEKQAAWSDKEFKKRPKWYRDTVFQLEKFVKRLSLYSYIEDPDFLKEAIDFLRRVENVGNYEITWRLGRAYIENSQMFPKKPDRMMEYKVDNLEHGMQYLQKAIQMDPTKASANKWYAIGLYFFMEYKPSHPIAKKDGKRILEFLQKAYEADKNDAITVFHIGLEHFKKKDYKEAIKWFQLALELKPNFFVAPVAYMGIAMDKSGDKDGGIATCKQSLKITIRNRIDRRAKMAARKHLWDKYHLSREEVAVNPEY